MAAKRDVFLQSLWISRVVFCRSKLKRIDEETYNDEIAAFAGSLDKSMMSWMEGSHGGDETNGSPLATSAPSPLLDALNRPYDSHL